MCCVCLYLASEATLILAREGHALHTLGEPVREVVVLGYSSPAPMESGWVLKLGRFMCKSFTSSLLILEKLSSLSLFLHLYNVENIICLIDFYPLSKIYFPFTVNKYLLNAIK